ncbi:hypothetical protein LOTGIDRAFT_220592, partial [Lottia gigantea]
MEIWSTILLTIKVLINISMSFGKESDALPVCDSNTQSSKITCDINNNNTSTDILIKILNKLKNGRTFDNLHIRCQENSKIFWNSSAFVDTFKSLKVEECFCETDQTVIQINATNLQSLEFFKVNTEFFKYVEIDSSIHLSSLSINRCGLPAIPEFVLKMDRSNLQKLFLKTNQITHINCELFKGVPCLDKKCYLNLFGNQIVDIPDCVCKPSIIWYNINFYNNRISNVSNLQCLDQIHVDAQDNSIEELPNFTFIGTITIDFTFNKIKRIRRETFSKSKLCSTISLSYN